MPTFISNEGKWVPAKEKIGLTNLSDKDITYNGKVIKPGEPFIYDGPDRMAIKVLNDEGVEHLGNDFRTDPEFRQAVRNQGFENIDQYLKHMGYDEKKEQEKFAEKSSVVKAHEIPKRHQEILTMGGGKDLSGNKNNDLIGGFGDERERKPEEIKVGKK